MRNNAVRTAIAMGSICALATGEPAMSPADAEPSPSHSGHPEAVYGKALREVRTIPFRNCMDATAAGDTLYAIGGGQLRLFSITDPANPQLLGSIGRLGGTRQIEVANGIAYIASRPDGLFLIDVRQPAAPRIISHFDTIEMATGIWITGDIALVALRHYGVQLVDVSDPAAPKHLSVVRTGEAQSVVARDGIAYVGVWGSRELVLCDIRNPRRPTVVSKTKLDGYGDGVWVRGTHCFVATGHHGRGASRHDESDPKYGAGHGLEIFDVSDPAAPKLVSRLKMPRFYHIGMDMWDVAVAGDTAFVPDTHNGFFAVDVTDVRAPRFLAHRRLPYIEARKLCSPNAGFAATHDYVYLAGAWSGLHVVHAPGLARPIAPDPDRAPTIPAQTVAPPAGMRVYRPNGQVWAVDLTDDTAWVAAGRAGLHQVRLWPTIQGLAEHRTEGLVFDVKVRGDMVYVAEGFGGLSIWRRAPHHRLELIGRYVARGKSVKQVVVPARGGYALIQAGAHHLDIVDISDPAHPRRALRGTHLGLLYGYQITDGLFGDRYACCFWHVTGFHWYDLYGGNEPVYAHDNYAVRSGAANGMAMLPDGNRALCTMRDGRYFILTRGETRPFPEIPKYGAPNATLRGGKPTLAGNTLFMTDRASGSVTILDVSDLQHPVLLKQLALDGNPGIVREHRGRAVIPAAYQGLLVSDAPLVRREPRRDEREDRAIGQ